MPLKDARPSLKSASGADFTFEDKVSAMLLSEMLMGIHSFGVTLGAIQKLERQASDWEPFGDLLLDLPNSDGNVIRIGGSVKSSRLVNANGCNAELCSGMWMTSMKPAFSSGSDLLLLASAPLSASVSDHLSSLCRQAKSMEAERLNQKIVHAYVRKIYESFRNASDPTAKGLPGNILAKLIYREFDFEAAVSGSEKEALRLCRDLLHPEEQNAEKAKDLWKYLCDTAQELRVSGGTENRGSLAAGIRNKFRLQDDASDAGAWAKIRIFSRVAMEEIETSLPRSIQLPRRTESDALRAAVVDSRACHVLGDSGSGKSAMIKGFAIETQTTGAEVVWIKGERLDNLISVLPEFSDVLVRCRRASALLVVDALEGCTSAQSFNAIAKLVLDVMGAVNSQWRVVFACHTPDWARVCAAFIRHLAGHPILTKRVDCSLLAEEDFKIVCAALPTVESLAREPKIRKFLSTPKMLDVLLSGQLAEGRAIAGEADLVDWWWEQQVLGSNLISAEESVARKLACDMADGLRSELPPDTITGAEQAATRLIRSRVLRRTQDGLIRFEHDLLADWSSNTSSGRVRRVEAGATPRAATAQADEGGLQAAAHLRQGRRGQAFFGRGNADAPVPGAGRRTRR